MVCHGPDPPDSSPQELVPPPRNELIMNGNGDDSDDDHEYYGYEPLAQGPEMILSDHDTDEDTENVEPSPPPGNVPNIEPMENSLAREVWNAPRQADPIQMDNEHAQQVMRAMANFALPEASIPEWAQSINEEQWKQTLKDRIEKIKNNR